MLISRLKIANRNPLWVKPKSFLMMLRSEEQSSSMHRSLLAAHWRALWRRVMAGKLVLLGWAWAWTWRREDQTSIQFIIHYCQQGPFGVAPTSLEIVERNAPKQNTTQVVFVDIVGFISHTLLVVDSKPLLRWRIISDKASLFLIVLFNPAALWLQIGILVESQPAALAREWACISRSCALGTNASARLIRVTVAAQFDAEDQLVRRNFLVQPCLDARFSVERLFVVGLICWASKQSSRDS